MKKVIIVMGMCRSGTNALFYSLAKDKSFKAFSESPDNVMYLKWQLRPEPEIRSLLHEIQEPVLFKDVSLRDIRKLTEEYSEYNLHIVWIYRNPVNVFYSAARRWGGTIGDFESQRFVLNWNNHNQKILSIYSNNKDRINIVKYEDLIADSIVFSKLCKSLGVRGQYLFNKDSKNGQNNIPGDLQKDMLAVAGPTLRDLDKNRNFIAECNFFTSILNWLFRMRARVMEWVDYAGRFCVALTKVAVGKKKFSQLLRNIKNVIQK